MERQKVTESKRSCARAFMLPPPVQGLKGVFSCLYHPDRKRERCKRQADHNKPQRGKGRQHRHQRQQQPRMHSPPGCRPVYICFEGRLIGIQIFSNSHPLPRCGPWIVEYLQFPIVGFQFADMDARTGGGIAAQASASAALAGASASSGKFPGLNISMRGFRCFTASSPFSERVYL